MTLRFFSLLVLLAIARPLLAQENIFTSGATRTHLLELYTSEGCSSCPPAEAWLNGLKDAPGLWRDFVPVAFHVDYWDRLGWRDPFASKQWTARQYAYAARWGNRSVYTPGFVLDGREMRERVVPGAAGETIGVLRLDATDPANVRVTFQPAQDRGQAYEANVARLGFDLRTDVKAGENRGRKLAHDFVVLSLARQPLAAGGTKVNLPAGPAAAAGKRVAIVAWITEAGATEPLQAVGGFLSR